MTIAVVLLGYAMALATGAPRVFLRSEWLLRSPRLAIAAWQAVSASAIGAVTLAGVALMIPSMPMSTALGGLLQACLMAVRHAYASPVGPDSSLVGLVLVGMVLMRSVSFVLVGFLRLSSARRRHAEALSLVAHHSRHPEAVVLQHATPAAYCLAGRHSQVVLTSAALEALDEIQLQAVLTHERAHLAGRHHLAVSAADSLSRAFPRVPLFRRAREEIARLVELAADDTAARQFGSLAVAEALVTLTSGPTPTVALAASGHNATERVRRLLEPSSAIGWTSRIAGLAMVAALLVAPVLGAAAPAFAASANPVCPMGSTNQMLMSSPCLSYGSPSGKFDIS